MNNMISGNPIEDFEIVSAQKQNTTYVDTVK